MTKKSAPKEATLGSVAGSPRTPVAGLTRLESAHPAVKHILEIFERLQARPFATSAIIGGEPGTGKEGLARTLHEIMHPGGAPLVSVSTTGRREEELAVELFGSAPHSRGERPTAGAVERADEGSLILEETAGLSPALQRRLLEVLRSGTFRREGETRERTTEICVIALTDGNLAAEVAQGRFRHDLYHKLARLDLVLPPLRERPEDVRGAAEWMAHRVLSSRDLPTKVTLDPAALDTLRMYRWPGNFRELEIIIERALMLYGDGKTIKDADVLKAMADPRS